MIGCVGEARQGKVTWKGWTIDCVGRARQGRLIFRGG